jgi:hypothetical protein
MGTVEQQIGAMVGATRALQREHCHMIAVELSKHLLQGRHARETAVLELGQALFTHLVTAAV